MRRSHTREFTSENRVDDEGLAVAAAGVLTVGPSPLIAELEAYDLRDSRFQDSRFQNPAGRMTIWNLESLESGIRNKGCAATASCWTSVDQNWGAGNTFRGAEMIAPAGAGATLS